jgi:hypothetical protein
VEGAPPLPWRHELDIGGEVVYVPVPAPYPLAPFFAPPPPFYPQSPEEELAMLESYRDALARELERVGARIKELKQQLGKS